MAQTKAVDTIRVGTAGWSVPKPQAAEFGSAGSHLYRYSRRLPAVEINSSFYRSHRPQTYARWAASVPPGFRFAVKVPREITHRRKLVGADELVDRFVEDTQALGAALGPLLVQLPPGLPFDEATVCRFFEGFRNRFDGYVVCEPRHPTWFTAIVDTILSRFSVARVAADPAPVPQAALPGGWDGLIYWRLHGSPRMYYSGYSAGFLQAVAGRMQDAAVNTREQWCIFDNTALGEATHDALVLMDQLNGRCSD